MEQLINDERKIMGSMKETDIKTDIAKRLRITENRLDQVKLYFEMGYTIVRQAKTHSSLRYHIG